MTSRPNVEDRAEECTGGVVKVLVAGASGFVGQRLCAALEQACRAVRERWTGLYVSFTRGTPRPRSAFGDIRETRAGARLTSRPLYQGVVILRDLVLGAPSPDLA
jgi:nucleoside-diphosphate-sugar epimerase